MDYIIILLWLGRFVAWNFAYICLTSLTNWNLLTCFLCASLITSCLLFWRTSVGISFGKLRNWIENVPNNQSQLLQPLVDSKEEIKTLREKVKGQEQRLTDFTNKMQSSGNTLSKRLDDIEKVTASNLETFAKEAFPLMNKTVGDGLKSFREELDQRLQQLMSEFKTATPQSQQPPADFKEYVEKHTSKLEQALESFSSDMKEALSKQSSDFDKSAETLLSRVTELIQGLKGSDPEDSTVSQPEQETAQETPESQDAAHQNEQESSGEESRGQGSSRDTERSTVNESGEELQEQPEGKLQKLKNMVTGS